MKTYTQSWKWLFRWYMEKESKLNECAKPSKLCSTSQAEQRHIAIERTQRLQERQLAKGGYYYDY